MTQLHSGPVTVLASFTLVSHDTPLTLNIMMKCFVHLSKRAKNSMDNSLTFLIKILNVFMRIST
ncbi:hypothetical protein DF3PB_4030004 [uncultured Defluviicoccus sp.]|uniref:Uncharacterized protein n=1 Tax=metagenome TaxID=256318 RepID=A0A380TG52_9ZZZZ|nr:hypothetical protein DF3PB_4030004 [uncultured Defluviicoccus sp.]